MGEGNTQFRGAAFGGFHRQDVMDYLTSTANEHERAVVTLQAELEQAHAKDEEQTKRIQELEAKLSAAEAGASALQKALEEAEADRIKMADRLLLCETELHDVRTSANEAIDGLRAEIVTLEPKAQAYEKLKERSAGIELDAHRRAQSTLDEADRESAQFRQEQARILREAQLRYELMCNSLKESFARSRVELDEVLQIFARTAHEFDGYEENLQDLVMQAEEGADNEALKKLTTFSL